MPVVEPRISGRVFELTPAGRQPIDAVAIVADFTGGLGWAPSATTLSDASGQYLLCATLSEIGIELIVNKPGYRERLVGVMGETTLDIELQRSVPPRLP